MILAQSSKLNPVRSSKSKVQSSNQVQKSKASPVWDLEERTAKFGEVIINFVRSLPHNDTNRPLISQLIRSSTSVGANYMEADCAESKKDFIHKISLCKKEAKETTHWLRMIAAANQAEKVACRNFWQEARELVLIFSAILKKRD